MDLKFGLTLNFPLFGTSAITRSTSRHRSFRLSTVILDVCYSVVMPKSGHSGSLHSMRLIPDILNRQKKCGGMKHLPFSSSTWTRSISLSLQMRMQRLGHMMVVRSNQMAFLPPPTQDISEICSNSMICSCPAPHQGTTNTWTHCNGETEHCIDHIAVPLRLQPWCTHSQVVEDFDLATANNDHRLVACKCNGMTPRSSPPRKSKKPYVRAEVKYVHHPEIHHQLLQIEAQSWEADLEHQTECITDHLHTVLKAHSRPAVCHAKKLYVTDEIWAMRNQKIALKKTNKAISLRLRRELLHSCVRAWKQSCHTALHEQSDDHSSAFQ